MALTKTKKSVIDVSSIMGGVDGAIQFKNGNDLGGSTDLMWDSVNRRLSVRGLEQDGLIGSAFSGHKNKIMNGCFRMAQRGEIAGTTDLAYNNQEAPLGGSNMNNTVIGGDGDWTAVNPTHVSYVPVVASLPQAPNSLEMYPLFDRWKMTIPASQDQLSRLGSSLSEHYTMRRLDFGYDQSTVTGNPKHYMQIQWGANQTYEIFKPYLSQHIENLLDMLGKTVTVSFYCKTDIADLKLKLAFFNRYNSDIQYHTQPANNVPNPSYVVESGQVTIGGENSWHLVNVTMDIPTGLGESTTGTRDSSESCEFRIYFEGTPEIFYTKTIDIAQVQVEEGNVATDFETVPFSVLVSDCERYFEKSYNLDTPPGSVTWQGIVRLNLYTHPWCIYRCDYKTDKRIVPIISRWGGCGRPNEHIQQAGSSPYDAGYLTITEYETDSDGVHTTYKVGDYWTHYYQPYSGGPEGWSGKWGTPANLHGGNWWWQNGFGGWYRGWQLANGDGIGNELSFRSNPQGWLFFARNADYWEIHQHFIADADFY